MLKELVELLESKTLAYDNWVRYTPESLKADFDEYKSKENKKWKSRVGYIGARFPIFDSLEQFKKALDSAKIIEINSLNDEVHNMTTHSSIADLEDLVSSYTYPRDVKRIVSGFKSNAQVPLPIIIKGSKGLWIMAGNTRQATAGILGVTRKALLVDVRN